MSLLDVGSSSASNLQRFCRISHKVARSHFSSKSGGAFRPGGSRGGFAPYAPAARLVSIRDTSIRMVRTVQRWARGFSTTSVKKQSTAPRETLLDCPVRSSFWRRPRVGV